MLRGALYKLWFSVARGFSQPRLQSEVIPTPVDAPRISVSGPDADRILFFGSGAIAGLGVSSYRSSFVGHASRQISDITRRGVDADVFADSEMSIRTVGQALDGVRIGRYDVIVVAIGFNDLFLRTSHKRWAEGITYLLDTVAASTSSGSSVFLMGIGDPSHSPLLRNSLSTSAASRARAFNRISARIVASRPGVTFLPFAPGAMEGQRPFTSDVHAVWASQFAGPIAEALDQEFYSGIDRPGYALDREVDRVAATQRLGILDTVPEDRFDRIVKMARILLRTEAAAFSLIDQDRQWLKSAVGVPYGEVERSASFCNTTITQRGGLEVDDVLLDPRFVDSDVVTEDQTMRFYLGYPIESADGFPIGALCVFDPLPRHPSPGSMNLLRDLALLIQGELAR